MSTRIATKGSIIKHGASTTPTTVLAGVLAITPGFGERAMIKATAHDDTVTDKYIPRPLRETDTLAIEIAYDPADTGHEAIRAAYAANTTYYFTLVLPDAGAAEWAWVGNLTNFAVGALDPDTGLLKATISYKATGVATFTQ